MKHNKILKKESLVLNDFSETFGIGYKRVKILSINSGFNPSLIPIILKNREVQTIKKKFKNILYGKNLRDALKKKLIFLWYIRIYRGIRHKFKLPSRGQRTHTNARTKKKFKFF